MHQLQSRPEVHLRECAGCHACTASRIPRPHALDAYYHAYYGNAKSSELGSRTTVANRGRFCGHVSDRITSCVARPIRRVLDFGGGDGAIAYGVCQNLASSSEEDREIDVVDYVCQSAATPHDSSIQIRSYASLDEVPNETYDLVLASGVIEHLPDPRQVLTRLLKCVAVGGLFYARTPWVLPLQRLAKWLGIRLDFSFPGHIHDLGGDFWRFVFAGGLAPPGFQICVERPSPVETSVRHGGLITVCAHLLKAPWFVVGNAYKLVGGWEVFAVRNQA